jgi:hypothetical protein
MHVTCRLLSDVDVASHSLGLPGCPLSHCRRGTVLKRGFELEAAGCQSAVSRSAVNTHEGGHSVVARACQSDWQNFDRYRRGLGPAVLCQARPSQMDESFSRITKAGELTCRCAACEMS